MIEQLRSAADQLHAAWDNYYRVYSTVQNAPRTHNSSLEISRHLDTELAFISSCEPKIKQLKVSISHARNYSPGLVPINALPLETLSHIFHLAFEWPCELYQYSSNTGSYTTCYPRFPGSLAHVCSLWRRVATLSPKLWRHIDLSRDTRWYEGLIARAKGHVTHVGALPIELHVAEADDSRHTKRPVDYTELQEFLPATSHRVKTLEIVANGGFGPFHYRVLAGLTLGQNSALTRLITRSRKIRFENDAFISADLNTFDMDALDEEESRRFPVSFTEDQLEHYFASITDLHLCGIFPLWTSTAYHGLVDLRLVSPRGCSDHLFNITDIQLLSILKSSPGLRIIHFGLEFRRAIPDAEPTVPVHLENLQVVKVFSAGVVSALPYLHPSHILPLLAPGTKPLWLSFDDYYPLVPVSDTELDSFFARSKVARFYTCHHDPPIGLLVRHSANLECVIIEGLSPYDKYYPARRVQVDPNPSEYLKSLHLLHPTIAESDLSMLLRWCPSGTVLVDPRIIRNKAWGTMLSKEELLDAFPMVTLLNPAGHRTEEWDPTAEWDLLD